MPAQWRALSILLLLAAPAGAAPEEILSPAATHWWADISAIASDANQGRLTGSPGYMRAANYVISRLKAEGLKPAGQNGYLQMVRFEQQVVDQKGSRVQLTRRR